MGCSLKQVQEAGNRTQKAMTWQMGCDTRSGRVLQGGAGEEAISGQMVMFKRLPGIAGPGAESENKHCTDSSTGESCQSWIALDWKFRNCMWQNLNINCREVMRRVMIQLHVSSYEDRNKCFCLDNVNFETPFIYSSGEDQWAIWHINLVHF